ncbi:MAG: GGDEF domain-containing protein [Lachnospiraceae bacterium]|nr:GGDEF domain-containing protein [Lachnospiraceae bacterium]
MAIYDNEKWVEHFGKSWRKLTEVRKDIGGFLLFKESKEVLADENALSMIGFSALPSYEDFKLQLEWIKNYSGMNATVSVYHLTDNDELECGIVCLERKQGLNLFLENIPFVDRDGLVEYLQKGSDKKLLMLIKLENMEVPSMLAGYIYSALTAINSELPEGSVFSRYSDSEYWVFIPDFSGNAKTFTEKLRKKVAKSPLTDEFGYELSAKTGMTFSAGISMDESLTPAMLMHAASYALFTAMSHGKGSTEIFSGSAEDIDNKEYNRLGNFIRLIDNNLFHYHFQPIISARNGDIVAYEALMRTDPDIGMNPLEILDLADKYNRLYDIEYATLNNCLRFLSENQSMFDNKRLFINAIPSHMLTEEDFEDISSRYGEIWERVVIELTEQTDADDELLAQIMDRLTKNRCGMAIDDYGTGYSNTSRLLKYNPEVVKLDRSLVAGIDSNTRKQNMVTGLVDYVHSQGGKVLGEGVETAEELETLIDLGCDLFQGYYISMPKPVLVEEIASDVKDQIEKINLETNKIIKRVYTPADGEVMNYSMLIDGGYTDIILGDGEFRIEGDASHMIQSTITIKEGAVCELYFNNAYIMPEPGRAGILLGGGSNVRLFFKGKNLFNKSSIYVPESAKLYIGGKGDLTLHSENRDCFAIGTNSKNAFGEITIDLIGKLEITTNGEYCVAIGGGKTGKTISVHNGIIILDGSGANCLGIGSIFGTADVNIASCTIEVKFASANICGIGSLEGGARVTLHNMTFKCSGAGSYFCGIGTLNGHDFDLTANKILVAIDMRGKRVVNIGSYGGRSDCRIGMSTINFYSEGDVTSGVGDANGVGQVLLTDVTLDLKFLSAHGFACGSKESEALFVRVKDNISINA